MGTSEEDGDLGSHHTSPLLQAPLIESSLRRPSLFSFLLNKLGLSDSQHRFSAIGTPELDLSGWQSQPAQDQKHLSKMSKCLLLAVVVAMLPLLALGRPGVSDLLSLGERNNGYKFPDLYTATLDEVAEGLKNGHFTSQDLTRAYINRIDEVNEQLRAVIEVNPHALQEAKLADEARQRGSPIHSPLYGVPIIVKDNIATARLDDSYMNTTAGSYALVGSYPAQDSTVAAKLKAAGAIILGKSNLSQWANYRSTNSTNGWSARGGQCTAAYVKNQDPSGSSSGSGVASSIGLALATLGSETDGSIVSPSQNSNLCGIKPTVGLTSRYLVIPISATQDTVGPMARDCKTAAQLLTAIAGKDIVGDAATAAIPFDSVPDYGHYCTDSGLKGARIGVPTAYLAAAGVEQAVSKAFNSSFKVIESLGATVKENADFSALESFLNNPSESVVLDVDFIFDLKDYLDKLYINPEDVHTLQDVLAYTIQDPREDYPDRNVAIWEEALGRNLTRNSPDYLQALANDTYLGTSGTIVGALDKYDLDAIIVPTDVASGLAAIAGLPIVTVPLGFYPEGTEVAYNSRKTLVNVAPNVPFGLSFLGRRFSEEKLIAYACAFESATKVRKNGPTPYVLPSTSLADIIASK